MVARLEEACASAATMGPSGTGCLGEDPALDQFMEAYCEMLTKYEQELSKPFKEAMLFLQRVECQFKALTVSSPSSGDNTLSLSLVFVYVCLCFLNLSTLQTASCYEFWIIAKIKTICHACLCFLGHVASIIDQIMYCNGSFFPRPVF